MVNLEESGPKILGFLIGGLGVFAVIAGLNYINGTAPISGSWPTQTTIDDEPPQGQEVRSTAESDSEGEVKFSITKTTQSDLMSEVAFKATGMPANPVKIELKIRCHGCKETFTRAEAYDFEKNAAFSTRRECPHCGSDLSFGLQLSKEADGLAGTIRVKGETHMKHQTPEAVGLEILAMAAGGELSPADQVLQLIRQGTQALPLELLSNLEDVNIVDEEGLSLLSLLCNKYTRKEVDLLIRKGADLNHRSQAGVFPLMAAVTSYSVENVKALLEAGVDVNRHANRSGVTALHQAVYATRLMNFNAPDRPEKAMEIAFLLLDAGANPDTRDVSGDTPLSEAEGSLADREGKLKNRIREALRGSSEHTSSKHKSERPAISPISWYQAADRSVFKVKQMLDLLQTQFSMEAIQFRASPATAMAADRLRHAIDYLFNERDKRLSSSRGADFCDYLSEAQDRQQVLTALRSIVTNLSEVAEEGAKEEALEAIRTLLPAFSAACDELAESG